jgi:hypothetical protein
VEKLLNGVYALTGHMKGAVPDDTRTFEVAGVRVYELGKAFQAVQDGVLLLTNERGLMEQVLRRAAPADDRLSQDRSYWECRRNVPEEAPLWAFLRVARVREQIESRRPIPAELDNPLGGLLFGGWWHDIRHAETALAWVTLGDAPDKNADAAGGLGVELRLIPAADLPDTHRGFLPPPVAVGWDASALPSFLGEISVARDWAGLFSQRETLLTVQGASQLVNFSSTMSTLLGGLDFMNDVLPAIHGPVRFIATRQDFSRREPLPVPKLPAFALVAPLAEQQLARLSQRLSTGLQMAVSILNLENAQQGRPTYVIDVDRHAGVRYFFTDFGLEPDAAGMSGGMSGQAPKQPDGADPPASAPASAEGGVRYNFRPAAAIVGRELVIATSAELLRDIIDASLKGAGHAAGGEDDGAAQPARPPGDAPPAGDFLRIDGAALTGLLRENRRELVINGVLEGKSQATAENEIDLVLALAAFVREFQVELQRGPDAVHARARVRLDWDAKPAGAKPEAAAKP